LSTYALLVASVLAVGVATFRIRLDPMSLLKPERATRFCVSFTKAGMEPPEVGIVGLSRSSMYEPVKMACQFPSSNMAVEQFIN
jgi:hypothetical protein